MSALAKVGAKELRWALKAALPHVSADDTLPALAALRIEIDPEAKAIWCVGTDRYTIGVARVAGDIDGSRIEAASLAPADVEEIRRRLKDGEDTVELEIDGDAITGGTVTLDRFDRWRVATEMKYADWRELLGKALRHEASIPADDIGYYGPYLARFAPAEQGTRNRGALVFVPVTTGSSSEWKREGGMFLVLGKDFVGGIMGRREVVRDALLSFWRDVIAAPEGGAS